jgi:hypothetical protein
MALTKVDASSMLSGQIPASQLPIVATPTNTSPASGTTGVNPGQVLTASAFAALYGYTFTNAQWQISTSSGFGTTVYDSGESGSAVTSMNRLPTAPPLGGSEYRPVALHPIQLIQCPHLLRR